MGLLELDVGPLGGGKTTRAAWRVLDYKQRWPWIPRVGNIDMPQDITFVSDIMKFLDIKFIREGNKPGSERTPMLVIVDEANTSGLEARGSGASVGDTTVLQYARKLKVHICLISQLMSMTDKRGQWLAHFYVLCKGVYDPRDGLPMRFEYKIYDENYHYQKLESLTGKFCEQAIFPKFDTWSIPNYDKIAVELFRKRRLGTDDFEDYDRIVRQYTQRSPMGEPENWLGRRWSKFWDMSEHLEQVAMARNIDSEMPPITPKAIPKSDAADLLSG